MTSFLRFSEGRVRIITQVWVGSSLIKLSWTVTKDGLGTVLYSKPVYVRQEVMRLCRVLKVDSARAHALIWVRKNGLCDICRAPGPLNIDHRHSDGLIRGFLCVHCNTAIGLLENSNPGWAAYLSSTIPLSKAL